MSDNTTGSYNTGIGYGATVGAADLINATAIGNGAVVATSNTIQLGADGTNGTTASSDVKTSGRLTTGTITYPNTPGNAGEYLTTNGSGIASWATATGSGSGSGVTSQTTTNSDPFDFGGTDYASTSLNVTNAENLSNGMNVLAANTSGIANVGIGINVLTSNTTGNANTSVGFNALKSNTNGSLNSAFGSYALYSNTTGSYNTAFGGNALISNSSGNNNIAFGEWAMLNNTTGQSNTASGTGALKGNTTGADNTASGRGSLEANLSGSFNTAIGRNSLKTNTTGLKNTAIGYAANVGAFNLENATAIGNGAVVAASNTIQLGNTAVTDVKTSGNLTVNGLTVGKGGGNVDGNTAIGVSALSNNTSGASNTAIGAYAMLHNKTGIGNTALGYGANYSSPMVVLNNATAIGFNAKVDASNTIQLGNTDVTDVKTSGAITAGGKVIAGASSAASPSAVLEASSTTQGFLPPRMTSAQRDAISTPVAGLVMWCTNCGPKGELNVYNGTEWTNMMGTTVAAVPTLKIGDSYLGGKVAYLLENGDLGYNANIQHGLIAATADQITGIQWYNSSYPNTGVIGTAIGTGLANTNAIITAQGTSTNYAARLARAYTGGGYNDWFLPSKDELDKLYLNRVDIGGFGSFNYWTSTELDANNAYFQDFSSGIPDKDDKSAVYNVRPVRSF
jgi:hypothetical protein